MNPMAGRVVTGGRGDGQLRLMFGPGKQLPTSERRIVATPVVRHSAFHQKDVHPPIRASNPLASAKPDTQQLEWLIQLLFHHLWSFFFVSRIIVLKQPLHSVTCLHPMKSFLWSMDASTKGEYKERRLGQKNLFAFSSLRAAGSSPLDRTTARTCGKARDVRSRVTAGQCVNHYGSQRM
jgi:hypothetical protein